MTKGRYGTPVYSHQKQGIPPAMTRRKRTAILIPFASKLRFFFWIAGPFSFAGRDCLFLTWKKPGVHLTPGFFVGGDGEIRTLAPVSRPTPLAGAPRHQLEYISRLVIAIDRFCCLLLNSSQLFPCPQRKPNRLLVWLAERVGFEPTALSGHWFSRPAP